MNATHKLKWEKPSYFPLKEALIKSGTSYFPGVEGAKCLVTPGFTGNTTPTSIVPVTNTVFSYTGNAGCGNVNTVGGPSLCQNFEGTNPCTPALLLNYDLSVNVCSTCF